METQQSRIDAAPKTVRCCPQHSAGRTAGDAGTSAQRPRSDPATVAEAIPHYRPMAETDGRPASTD